MKPGDLVGIRESFRGSRIIFNDEGGWAGDFLAGVGLVVELNDNFRIGKSGSLRDATGSYAKIITGDKIGWFRTELLEVIR
jgi:hypothetical protein